MKGISKWAGRLQTRAQGQFPIIVIYYPGQIVMPDTESSIASATGRQVITSAKGGRLRVSRRLLVWLSGKKRTLKVVFRYENEMCRKR